MKKERNCAVPYPIYPQMQMMPIPNMPYNMNYQENDLTNLNNQVQNLERRVAALEGLLGNNYNTTNYQMM